MVKDCTIAINHQSKHILKQTPELLVQWQVEFFRLLCCLCDDFVMIDVSESEVKGGTSSATNRKLSEFATEKKMFDDDT